MATKSKKTPKTAKNSKKGSPKSKIKPNVKKPKILKKTNIDVEETSKGVYTITKVSSSVNEQITDAITASPISYNINNDVSYNAPSTGSNDESNNPRNFNSDIIQENASYSNIVVPRTGGDSGLFYVAILIGLMLLAWMFVL